MSYHGFGQFYPAAGVPAVSTSQPTTSFQAIPPPSSTPKIGVIELSSNQPFIAAGSIPLGTPTEPYRHRAPAVLPKNYSKEAMGCYPKKAQPIAPGQPGYPGFLCVDKLPTSPVLGIIQLQEFKNIATGSSGSVSIAGIPTQKTATGTPPAKVSSSEKAPGAPTVQTKQPSGTVTPAAFAAACKQVKGTMGTNCCKLPTGVNMGLSGGNLVKVTKCDVSATGLGKNLPLIAGAAVAILLLTRGM